MKKDSELTNNGSDLPAKIAENINELINCGTLAPGLQLRQEQLATRFNVSRVPIREALKILTAEGAITHDPNRGFFIATLSSEEARQIYRIRHLLEVELLSTIEFPSEFQLADLQLKIDELRELLQTGKRAEWVVRHREFYQTIFDLSPQKILVREVLRLLKLTDRYRSLAPIVLDASERNVAQERHLIEALTNRDRESLLRIFEEDRTRIERGLLASLESRGL